MFNFLYHSLDHFWGKAVFAVGAAIAYAQVATMGAATMGAAVVTQGGGIDVLRVLSIISVALTILLTCTKLCPAARRLIRFFSRRPLNQRTGVDRRKCNRQPKGGCVEARRRDDKKTGGRP